MSKFRVQLRRTVSQVCTIDLEAASWNEAEKAAKAVAVGPHPGWKVDAEEVTVINSRLIEDPSTPEMKPK